MLLGIDIGGSTIHLGLVKGTEIVKKTSHPSFNKGASLEETISYLKTLISDILTPEVTSIGIGVPSLVDTKKGIVYDACNIPSWKEVHLKEEIEAAFGVPVEVNNDANCYTLGAFARLGGEYSSITCVTLGTGTGMGIVLDGHLYEGAHCGAGEIGSLAYRGVDFESFCSKKFFTDHGVSPREVSDGVEMGNPAAKALMDEFGTHLGELMAVVMYTYDPDCIVLGGGIANCFPYFEPAMRKTLGERYIYPRFLESIKIVPMPEDDTPLLGASLL